MPSAIVINPSAYSDHNAVLYSTVQYKLLFPPNQPYRVSIPNFTFFKYASSSVVFSRDTISISHVLMIPSSSEGICRNLSLKYFKSLRSLDPLTIFPLLSPRDRLDLGGPPLRNVTSVGTLATKAAKNPSTEPSVFLFTCVVPAP